MSLRREFDLVAAGQRSERIGSVRQLARVPALRALLVLRSRVWPRSPRGLRLSGGETSAACPTRARRREPGDDHGRSPTDLGRHRLITGRPNDISALLARDARAPADASLSGRRTQMKDSGRRPTARKSGWAHVGKTWQLAHPGWFGIRNGLVVIGAAAATSVLIGHSTGSDLASILTLADSRPVQHRRRDEPIRPKATCPPRQPLAPRPRAERQPRRSAAPIGPGSP